MFDPDADLVSGLLRLGLEGVGRGRGSHTWHANEEKKKVASQNEEAINVIIYHRASDSFAD